MLFCLVADSSVLLHAKAGLMEDQSQAEMRLMSAMMVVHPAHHDFFWLPLWIGTQVLVSALCCDRSRLFVRGEQGSEQCAGSHSQYLPEGDHA